MDKWAELRAFVATVEQQSFTGAANVLRMAPSGISRLMSNLETRLGVRLLHRTTRQISLTEAGARFYSQTRDILISLEEAEADVIGRQSMPKGTLKISCVVTLAERWLPQIIADFLARYPDIFVDLIETDRPVDLIDDGVDVALATGSLANSSHMIRKLAGFQRLVVASPAYLKRMGNPETPAALKSHECLSFATAPHLQRWSFQTPTGRTVATTVKGRFSATGAETILQSVLAGVGIARLASFMVAPHLRSGELEEVLTDFRVADPVPLFVAYQSGVHLSPKIRTFIDHLTDHFKHMPPWERSPGKDT